MDCWINFGLCYNNRLVYVVLLYFSLPHRLSVPKPCIFFQAICSRFTSWPSIGKTRVTWCWRTNRSSSGTRSSPGSPTSACSPASRSVHLHGEQNSFINCWRLYLCLMDAKPVTSHLPHIVTCGQRLLHAFRRNFLFLFFIPQEVDIIFLPIILCRFWCEYLVRNLLSVNFLIFSKNRFYKVLLKDWKKLSFFSNVYFPR